MKISKNNPCIMDKYKIYYKKGINSVKHILYICWIIE